MEKWSAVEKLRDDVNAVLEAARAEKKIGKALEAHVALHAGDDAASAALVQVMGLNLAELFIVSDCQVSVRSPMPPPLWARVPTSPASPWKSARPEATSASGAGCTAPLWAPTRITHPLRPAAPPWCGNSPSSDHPKTAVKRSGHWPDLFPCRFNSPARSFFSFRISSPAKARVYSPSIREAIWACTAGPALPASGLC